MPRFCPEPPGSPATTVESASSHCSFEAEASVYLSFHASHARVELFTPHELLPLRVAGVQAPLEFSRFCLHRRFHPGDRDHAGDHPGDNRQRDIDSDHEVSVWKHSGARGVCGAGGLVCGCWGLRLRRLLAQTARCRANGRLCWCSENCLSKRPFCRRRVEFRRLDRAPCGSRRAAGRRACSASSPAPAPANIAELSPPGRPSFSALARSSDAANFSARAAIPCSDCAPSGNPRSKRNSSNLSCAMKISLLFSITVLDAGLE